MDNKSLGGLTVIIALVAIQCSTVQIVLKKTIFPFVHGIK